MKEKDGGPAFPQHYCDNCNDAFESPNGMTLRDYFAGQALAAKIMQADRIVAAGGEVQPEDIALGVYRIADAMLAERDK